MKTGSWVPFLQILVPALSVCFIFTVTIGVFPAITAEVKSSIGGSSAWGEDTVGSQDGDVWAVAGLGVGEKRLWAASPQLDSPSPLALPWGHSGPVRVKVANSASGPNNHPLMYSPFSRTLLHSRVLFLDFQCL